MQLNGLAFAVPLFIGFMLVEYWVAKKMNKKVHQLHRAIANVSIGIAERICDVFAAVAIYYVYDAIQKKYGVFHIKSSVPLWIVLFLLTDFIWYWYHRWGHEINLFWMAHIVHHQSEDYNYTTSARITIFQALIRSALWAFLPLLGFPAAMISSILLIHGLYPFFLHTQLIGHLGFVEYVFVTPAHHRVHHASNKEYLDKNYGDVLIIWDKLLGTFKKEDPAIPIQYGLTKPLKTYSFLWQHFHSWIELYLAMQQASGWKQKCRLLWARPDSIHTDMRVKAEDIFHIKQNEQALEKPLNKYVIWQMVLLLVVLFFFLLLEHYINLPVKISLVAVCILTLINCGAIMEQKRWIFLVEFLRVLALSFLSFYSLNYWQLKLLGIVIGLLLLLQFYSLLKKYYLSLVYGKNLTLS